MKKYLAALFIIALCSVASVYAMDTSRATVPFDFIVGGKTLPPGDYVFQATDAGVVIREFNGTQAVFTIARPAQRTEIPEVIAVWQPGPIAGTVNNPALNKPSAMATGENCVVFNKYGNQFFISKIWVGLGGREFPITPAENRLKTASMPIDRGIVMLDAAIH